ncbi:MAG: NusG domain II-containing protein [Eubacterium sp.]|nr:NusG domain II-containing protein [Eubacterium sp.]
MTKVDIILLITIVLLGVASIFIIKMMMHDGRTVRVTVDGNVVLVKELSADGEYKIEGYKGGSNLLTIKEGKAYVTEADCPDNLCVKQGGIGKTGETIICLPHRVMVEILGE